MSDDLQSLTEVFRDPETLSAISAQIGTDEASTRTAIAAALPALLGGMGVNAASDDGAASLVEAALGDHGGVTSLIDVVTGQVGGRAGDGQGIVDHVLGGEEGAVVNQLSGATGQSASLFKKLLPILAPIVMSWLAKRLTSSGAGAGRSSASAAGSSPVGDILGQVLGGLTGGGASQASTSGSLVDILGQVLGSAGAARSSATESADAGSSGSQASGADALGTVLGQIFGSK